MTDPELHELEMAEQVTRTMYESLRQSERVADHPGLLATAKELWAEAAASLKAYKSHREH